MAKILVIHGPNLNMLGTREPEHYARSTLAEIDQRLRELASGDGHEIECFQSNAEHALIERVHAAAAEVERIIINPAGLTHTSIALRDALLAAAVPFVEVHLSNIHAREPFRHRSYFSDAAMGVISGFGPLSYELAYRAAVGSLAAKD
jgi:3-dehydroquinate dehydratase-2